MKYIFTTLHIGTLLISLALSMSTSCNNSSNSDSPYPIRYYGADSIKQIESSLSYCGLELGKEYSRDSLVNNNWRYLDTYFKQYNPEHNNYIESFYTCVYSTFEDKFDPTSAKCKVYRTLNENIVYEIDVTVNRRDTAMVKAYLSKYGKSNVTKFNNDHWQWEYKNQNINLWLNPKTTSVVYRDSVAIKIYLEEVDSIEKEYTKALKAYQTKKLDKI